MPNSETGIEPEAEAFESFYLETPDGLFFAVKGHEHPPDRWIGVLRYAPEPDDLGSSRSFRWKYGGVLCHSR